MDILHELTCDQERKEQLNSPEARNWHMQRYTSQMANLLEQPKKQREGKSRAWRRARTAVRSMYRVWTCLQERILGVNLLFSRYSKRALSSAQHESHQPRSSHPHFRQLEVAWCSSEASRSVRCTCLAAREDIPGGAPSFDTVLHMTCISACWDCLQPISLKFPTAGTQDETQGTTNASNTCWRNSSILAPDFSFAHELHQARNIPVRNLP
jgi:hypothetical protein